MTTLTDDELLAWLAGFGLGDGPHAEVCSQFSARFRELLAQQEWQPIEDLEELGERVLLRDPEAFHGAPFIGWKTRSGEYMGDGFNSVRLHPDKFCPLPAPPKDGE